MRSRPQRTLAAALGLLVLAVAPSVRAAVLANSISVSGDSISRGFNANTSSCNYGDNVSRSWATGDDHGTSFCSAGPTGTYSHAERLECAAGGDITNFNDARTGATVLGDFATQATNIKLNLSSSLAPRYVPVFMGHNDACTHTTSKTGNSCSGDSDPISSADLPLSVEVILDPPAAETGQCGDARYPGPSPAPVCTFNATGSTLTCK